MKKVIVLVMSVGPRETNTTVEYLSKIGGKKNIIVCLPKQFEDNAESYRNDGVEVYVYDEKKYINELPTETKSKCD